MQVVTEVVLMVGLIYSVFRVQSISLVQTLLQHLIVRTTNKHVNYVVYKLSKINDPLNNLNLYSLLQYLFINLYYSDTDITEKFFNIQMIRYLQKHSSWREAVAQW